jgi:hypothetical protein
MLFPESVAVIVKLDAPAVVGVPLMTPLPVFSDNPPGSAPAVTAKLYGPVPPLAVIVWEYGVATVPLGNVGGVITIVAGAASMVTVYCRLP